MPTQIFIPYAATQWVVPIESSIPHTSHSTILESFKGLTMLLLLLQIIFHYVLFYLQTMWL